MAVKVTSPQWSSPLTEPSSIVAATMSSIVAVYVYRWSTVYVSEFPFRGVSDWVILNNAGEKYMPVVEG